MVSEHISKIAHAASYFHILTHSRIVCFFIDSSDRERTTTTNTIIIHHTTVRVEPDPMTAIQGGEQRPSDSPPTPTTDGSGTTQTPPMGGLLSPVTLSATRRLLLLPHKATGGATTQTRTTNVLPAPPIQRRQRGQKALLQLAWPPKTSFTPHGHRRCGPRQVQVSFNFTQSLVSEHWCLSYCFSFCLTSWIFKTFFVIKSQYEYVLAVVVFVLFSLK